MTSRRYGVAAACIVGTAVAVLPLLPAAAATTQPLQPTHACPSGAVPEDWMVDVPAGDWAETNIDCVSWWGVARGVSAGHYAPTQAVKRGQMALFLTRVITATGGTLPTPTKDYFGDDNGTAYETADNQIAAAGIASGNGTGFAPTSSVTRGQMAKFLVNTYQYRTGATLPHDGSYFTDVQPTAPFADYINAAAQAQIAGGYSEGTYRPGVTVNREQMATFLARLLDRLVTDAQAALPAAPSGPATARAAYVADDTQLYLRDLGAGTQTLLYTAPADDLISATAVSPGGDTVAFTQSSFDADGNVTATAVETVPATGGTPTSIDPTGALAADYVDGLSWGPKLIAAGEDNAANGALFLLDPTGATAAKRLTGPLAADCYWAQSLPTGQVLYSGCTDGVYVGDASGFSYGRVLSGEDIGVATASPDGQRIAFAQLVVDSIGDLSGTQLTVTDAVLGTSRRVLGSGSWFPLFVDEIGWSDGSTVLAADERYDAQAGTVGDHIVQAAADGSSAPVTLSWTDGQLSALSVLPAAG